MPQVELGRTHGSDFGADFQELGEAPFLRLFTRSKSNLHERGSLRVFAV